MEQKMDCDDGFPNNEKQLYFVERVVGKRRRGNNTEYRVKWEDYSSDENTWEPEENLIEYDCEDLIEDYESKQAEIRRCAAKLKRNEDVSRNCFISTVEAVENRPSTDKATSAPKNKKVKTGSKFDEGWEVEKILGVYPRSDCGLKFLIKWKNCDKQEYLSSELCRSMIPEKVIEFYEERIKW